MEKKELSKEVVDDKIIDTEEVKDETTQNTEAHKKEEDDDKKYDKLWIFAEPALFAYNTYVVFNNIMVGDGYLWVVLGIIVNIVIAVNYQSVFGRVFPKINQKWAFAVLAVLLFFSLLFVGGQHWEMLEESSVPIVSQILEEHYGKGNAAKCKEVAIDEEISDGLYNATAILNNGNKLKVVIEEVENNRIIVSIPQGQ